MCVIINADDSNGGGILKSEREREFYLLARSANR